MNNVWTSIAFRAPCAARAHRHAPLQQLFTCFAKYHSSAASGWTGQGRWQHSPHPGLSWTSGSPKVRLPGSNAKLFTTTATALARKRSAKPSPKMNPKILADSKLKRAPTAPSHTEKIPQEPQPEEALTWRDYDPAGGMPLPMGELAQEDIDIVFGGGMDRDTGNYILNVVHWRRMSGALIDEGLDFPKDSGVSKSQAEAALEYLRVVDPGFDDLEAGQRWAEEEAERLGLELRQRAVKLGLYKPLELPEYEEEDDPDTDYGPVRTGESVLVQQRKENEAAFAREQAEKQAKAEREELAAVHSQRGPLDLAGGVQPVLQHSPNAGVAIERPQPKAWLKPVERKAWVKYYEEQALVIKDTKVPQLSTLTRLGPSLAVALIVLSLCIYVSTTYAPPPRSARMFPDTPPGVATIGALTAVLFTTFILNRVPPLWRTFSKYFTLVPGYPYALSIVGSSFRHDRLAHLCSNLFSLWLCGLMLHEDVGRGTFLAIYFGSAVIGGYAGLLYNVARKQWHTYIFGCSGGVCGVVAALCVLHPRGTISVAGYEVPIAVWVFLALFGISEVVAAVKMVQSNIDHVGHIGGLAAGMAAAGYLRRQSPSKQEGPQMVRQDASPLPFEIIVAGEGKAYAANEAGAS